MAKQSTAKAENPTQENDTNTDAPAAQAPEAMKETAPEVVKATVAKDETVRKTLKLPPQRLTPDAQKACVWAVEIPDGHTLADMLRPDYWAHVAQDMNKSWPDKINCYFADGSRYVELLVKQADRLWAKVVVLVDVDLKTTQSNNDAAGTFDNHKVEFKGGVKKWSVIHKDTGEYVKDGFRTEAEAVTWLVGYKVKLAN